MRGMPPFGWQHEDGELVEHEAEQKVIKDILQRRSTKPPMSFGNIAAELNRAGVLNRGRFWNPSTLWYIVERESRR